MSRRLAALLLLVVVFRLDLMGEPFVEYFSNRQVQNAVPIRMMQEGGYTFWQLPNEFRDTYGIAEFPLLPLIVREVYAGLETVGLARLPARGDAAAAHRYYVQIAVIGRLWSLMMALSSLLLLHWLLRRAWSEAAADLAVFLYALLPHNRFYDQIFIAEPTIMVLSIAGLILLWWWGEAPAGRWAAFAAAAGAFSLVLMLKISHVFIGLPIAWLLWRRLRTRMLWHPAVWLFGAVVLLPAAAFYHVGLPGSSVAGLDGMAWDNTKALLIDPAFTMRGAWAFLVRHVWTVWTPLGACLVVAGLVRAWRAPSPARRDLGRLLAAWLAGWVYYWFMAGDMSTHFYYQVPSIPLAAALMAVAGESLGELLRPRVRLAALAGAAAFFFAWGAVIQRINDQESREWRGEWCRTILDVGLRADERLPPDAKIVAGCRKAIQFMVFYYAHRDGYSLNVEEGDQVQSEAPARLEELRSFGAQFYVAPFGYDGPKRNGVIFDRQVFDALPIAAHLRERYPVFDETADGIVFDLRRARTETP